MCAQAGDGCTRFVLFVAALSEAVARAAGGGARRSPAYTGLVARALAVAARAVVTAHEAALVAAPPAPHAFVAVAPAAARGGRVHAAAPVWVLLGAVVRTCLGRAYAGDAGDALAALVVGWLRACVPQPPLQPWFRRADTHARGAGGGARRACEMHEAMCGCARSFEHSVRDTALASRVLRGARGAPAERVPAPVTPRGAQTLAATCVTPSSCRWGRAWLRAPSRGADWRAR